MDPGGFERIFEEHAALVWSVIRAAGVPRADAEDLFMKSWEAVAVMLPSFSGRSKLTTWIAGIARKKCSDYARRKGPEEPADPAALERIEEDLSARRFSWGDRRLDPRLHAAVREARLRIDRATRALPPLQRMVFGLWAEGFTYAAIAEVAGKTGAGPSDANRVGVILVRARAAIRNSLREAGIRSMKDLM